MKHTIKLTPEEAEVLDGLLSLDLESLGFDDEEVELLEGIANKLNPPAKPIERRGPSSSFSVNISKSKLFEE